MIGCNYMAQNFSNANFVHQTWPLTRVGNGCTLNFFQCQNILTVTGNGNTINISSSKMEVNLTGNGNNIVVKDTRLVVGIQGNGNEVKVQGDPQTSQINVRYKNGFSNVVPQSNNQAFQPVVRPQRQQNRNQANFNSRSSQRIKYTHNNNIVNVNYRNLNEPLNNYSNNGTNNVGFDPRIMNNLPNRRRNVQMQNEDESSNFSYRQQRRYLPNKKKQNEDLNQQGYRALPKCKYQGKNMDCSICWQNMASGCQVIYLFCFHCFHAKCGLQWLKKSAKCPICQMDVNEGFKKNQQYG